MRIELWLILITSAIVFHIHTDGKYTKNILMHKKYIQMGGVVFGAFVLYILIKKNPANAQNIDYDGNNQLVQIPNNQTRNAERILHSGRKSTKRSVSETKKKFVASRQKWNCGECNEQLNAWFEVDHKIRLEYGGSNHVDNLVALCRECHGKKTTIENL